MKRLLGGALAFALIAGCAPKPPADPITIPPPAANLPNDPQALLRIADQDYAKQTPEGVQAAVGALEKANGIEKSYDALWRLSRAYSWLSDDATDDRNKEQLANTGMELAKQAVAAKPDRVEGHYYLGTTIGQIAYEKKLKAKDLVPQVLAEAKAAVKADPRFDHAGPLRLEGALLSQAPEPPTSVGDHEEGMRTLEHATQLAPDYPLNHLLLGDAYRVNQLLDKAEREYNTVLAAPNNPEWSRQLARWQDQARQGLRKVSTLRRQHEGSGAGEPF